MLISRLEYSLSRLGKLNRPWSILIQRNFAKKIDFDEEDKPIRYTTSPAAQWKAQYHRVPPNERVWFTPYSVSLSVAVFMLYFCILREENDIDEFIYQPLPKTIQGIDNSYPGFDFTQKPDYIVYHEKTRELQRKKKEEEKAKH